MVRKRGLEPPRPCGHKLLRLARLPIPPLPHREEPGRNNKYTKSSAGPQRPHGEWRITDTGWSARPQTTSSTGPVSRIRHAFLDGRNMVQTTRTHGSGLVRAAALAAITISLLVVPTGAATALAQ